MTAFLRKFKGHTRQRVFWRAPILIGALALTIGVFAYFVVPELWPSRYDSGQKALPENTTPKFVATHVKTHDPVKAIYMSSCVAGSPSIRSKLVAIATSTEINSIVIDIKDYSGTISFEPDSAIFKEVSNASTCRAKDMRDFIDDLHKNDIYVIGRITVFQDPYFTKKRPDLAVKRRDGTVWQDYKGLSFIDVSAKEYWDYIVALGKDAYNAGFDELNFDYVRFPSDGDMKNINFSWTGTTTKAVALENFFAYLHGNLKADSGPVLSVDLFGMTTTNTDDLNIGQVLERALPYFDYVAPMVYPSHYPPNFNSYANPAAVPYEVVKYSMDRAYARVKVFNDTVASTSPLKLRPWLQDFNLGATYTAEMVRRQIQAVYDSGLTSWMLWSAANTYTKGALMIEAANQRQN